MKKRKIPKKFIINLVVWVVMVSAISFGLTYYFNNQIDGIVLKYENAIEVRDREIQRYTSTNVESFVLVRDIEAGETITKADVQLVEIPGFYLPSNTISDPNDVIGKNIKVNAKKNTTITTELLYEKGVIDPSDRKIEIDYVNLPILLKDHDLIDIMIIFPTGETYRVVSKKSIDSMDLASQHLFITADQEERYLLSSALRDAYIYNAELYAIRYVDPELQTEPREDYHPNKAVLALLTTNAQVKNKDRYSVSATLRDDLEKRLAELSDNEMIRLGASLPSGSAVDQKRRTIGATIVVPAETEETVQTPIQPPETVNEGQDILDVPDNQDFIESDVYIPEQSEPASEEEQGIGAD